MEIVFEDCPSAAIAERLSELRQHHGAKAAAKIKTLQRKINRRQYDGYTAYDRNCALMLYLASDYDTDAAVSYLKFSGLSGRPLGSSMKSDSDLSRMIENWFLEVPLEFVQSLQDESAACQTRASKKVATVLKANQLAKWVRTLNIESGLAPSTYDLGTHFDEISGGQAIGALEWELHQRAALSSNRNRAFFKKFRKRWVLKLGKIKARQVVPASEMASQAQTHSLSVQGCIEAHSLDRSPLAPPPPISRA